MAQGVFDGTYRRSLEEREAFWADAAAAIDWDEPCKRVLDDSRAPFYRWFAGGRMNTCHNALDRHVEGGRADQTALIYDSPVTDTVRACSCSRRGSSASTTRSAPRRCSSSASASGRWRCSKQAVVVDRLPKTRSGKILRATMRRIADAEPYSTPATIDDPAILEEIAGALERIGYAQAKAPVGR